MPDLSRTTVAEVMTAEVVAAAPELDFKAIVALLHEHRISAVPVVDGEGVVVGVVSEADLMFKPERYDRLGRPARVGGMHRLSATHKADAVFAKNLMTAPAVTIEPTATVAAAARLMDKRRVKRLPVVENSGSLIGIVTRSDLLKIYLPSDRELQDRVLREVFGRVLWADAREVDVLVTDGMVCLSGRLPRKSSVDVAGALTAALDGVVHVENQLDYDIDDTAANFTLQGESR